MNKIENGFELGLKMPVEVSSDGLGVTAEVEFGVRIKFDNTTKWNLSLQYSPVTTVSKFECKQDKKWCQKVQEYLRVGLAADLMPFSSENGFDQPGSARMLLGVLGYINDFVGREIETLHPIVSDGVLQMFFNCHQASIKDVL